MLTRVKIICPYHGSFFQLPRYHIQGSGCPKCTGSNGEQLLMHYLDSNNVPYIFQHTFNNCLSKQRRPLVFDFFLPDNKMLIEFDGQQHFYFVPHFHGSHERFHELKQHDIIKEKYANANDYVLIRITSLSYEEIKNVLEHWAGVEPASILGCNQAHSLSATSASLYSPNCITVL